MMMAGGRGGELSSFDTNDDDDEEEEVVVLKQEEEDLEDRGGSFCVKDAVTVYYDYYFDATDNISFYLSLLCIK